jgi:hypothetical protein
LKPTARWTPTWCRVDSKLTKPAIARYRNIFPDDVQRLESGVLPYTWKATATTCEITPLDRSPLAVNDQAFLEVALCELVQTHFVNSPFDGLKPQAVELRDERAFVRPGAEEDLGIYLAPDHVGTETHTKAHGVLSADYAERGGAWVPIRLSARANGTTIVADQFEYDSPDNPRGRPRLKSFALAAGEGEPSAYAEINVYECQGF